MYLSGVRVGYLYRELSYQHGDDKVLISFAEFKIPKELCCIIPRHSWLAQKPMDDPQPLQLPVKYVVICEFFATLNLKTLSKKRRINQQIHLSYKLLKVGAK